jgi:predicted RNase H-like nuclease
VHVVGADGCPAGWLAVAMPPGSPGRAEARIVATAADLLALGAPVAIDVPIGLMNAAGERRPADLCARASLKRSAQDDDVRSGSPESRVFLAPTRAHLAAFRREPNWSRFREGFAAGHGISVQAFNICRKIDEADRLCRERPEAAVFEVHPEISFAHSAGRTLPPKAKPAGRAARSDLLASLGFDLDALVAALGEKGRMAEGRRRPRWNTDDLLDACIAAWSADRIARGIHAGLPNLTDTDSLGLRRVIHY